jgi:hypothetical protein
MPHYQKLPLVTLIDLPDFPVFHLPLSLKNVVPFHFALYFFVFIPLRRQKGLSIPETTMMNLLVPDTGGVKHDATYEL